MSKPDFTILISHITELNRQLTIAGLSEAERGPILAAEWSAMTREELVVLLRELVDVVRDS